MDFCVLQDRDYGSNISVSNFFNSDNTSWEVDKVNSAFSDDDARLILSMHIPQNGAPDRLAWTRTTTGHYTVETGYQLWHDTYIGTGNVVQTKGWSTVEIKSPS